MAHETIPLLGGKSVHCINEQQMEEAVRLTEEDPISAPKIGQILKEVETTLTRNEQAALAFMIIKKLKETANN